MNFLISDTFTSSLAKLNGDEQKAAKITVFDLQQDPSSPGLSFHKVDRAKDDRFWSVRVNRDVRIIVHRSQESLLVCYVDHHDKAYSWAERRKLETHPKTGAAQIVEVRESIREIEIPVYVQVEERPKPAVPLFKSVTDDELMDYGLPEDWLGQVRQVCSEDELLELVDHLPGEAAEALISLATGSKPALPQRVTTTDPFQHPDAKRRFRVMENVEELQRALEYPWEKWAVFLHPSQRDFVEKQFNGPARVSGSAGTGKTIVALHRAVHLVRTYEDERVLLTTFSEPLAASLREKVKRLIAHSPRLADRLEVSALDTVALRLYEKQYGKARLATEEHLEQLFHEAERSIDESRFTARFLANEWSQVIDPWQIGSWEEYRDVTRYGRRTRLSEAQRQIIWDALGEVKQRLSSEDLTTMAQVYGALVKDYEAGNSRPFGIAVVDEAQDISVAQLRFLSALGKNRPDSLFFAGDLGQRIFQTPFSWKSLGVNIQGRSQTLRVNYRTSHQIRKSADKLLASSVTDVDGNVEERNATISVFNGMVPTISSCASKEEEISLAAKWTKERLAAGVSAPEMGIFVRSEAQLTRAIDVAKAAGVEYQVLNECFLIESGKVNISTMHLAKGLEFRAVMVVACDDEVIPMQSRIESVTDSNELEEVYDTERHLLYVACTRARDSLWVSGVEPISEFLEDIESDM